MAQKQTFGTLSTTKWKPPLLKKKSAFSLFAFGMVGNHDLLSKKRKNSKSPEKATYLHCFMRGCETRRFSSLWLKERKMCKVPILPTGIQQLSAKREKGGRRIAQSFPELKKSCIAREKVEIFRPDTHQTNFVSDMSRFHIGFYRASNKIHFSLRPRRTDETVPQISKLRRGNFYISRFFLFRWLRPGRIVAA
jgi:hypothetical protein